MSVIAIIIARGGSKRIPKKNIKDFCGKPIITYSIEAAIKANVFDEVMVSTDSVEIAEIAKKSGANIPFLRSEVNANDFATTADVICEVLTEYCKIGRNFDYVCCIYPTAPFVTACKLKNAMEFLYCNPQYDSAAPVVQYSFPPQRAFKLKNDEIEIIYPDTFQMRSQDFEPIYHDCGQFYCMRVKEFLEIKRLVLNHTFPIVMPEMEVQDIDTLDDWEIAEIKYEKMINQKKRYI